MKWLSTLKTAFRKTKEREVTMEFSRVVVVFILGMLVCPSIGIEPILASTVSPTTDESTAELGPRKRGMEQLFQDDTIVVAYTFSGNLDPEVKEKAQRQMEAFLHVMAGTLNLPPPVAMMGFNQMNNCGRETTVYLLELIKKLKQQEMEQRLQQFKPKGTRL